MAAQYEVRARNFSESSENRIHSDDIARKYGFKGALVPGVAVYGHLTYPLVQAYGADWLGHSVDNLRLIKPAYHGDRLIVSMGADGVTCHNDSGDLLATLASATPHTLPKEDYVHLLEGEFKSLDRVEIGWDTVIPEQPFAPWEYTLTAEENARYTREVDDHLELYKDYVHPHLMCSLANTILTREYVMPTWIHVGTESRHHAPLKVGDTIAIRAVPVDKWERKGHQFIRIYAGFWRGDELTTDLLHTAIFRVAA